MTEESVHAAICAKSGSCEDPAGHTARLRQQFPDLFPDEATSLVTPCCGAPFTYFYDTIGMSYLTYERLGGIDCSAEGCYNDWDADGNPGPYNKPKGTS